MQNHSGLFHSAPLDIVCDAAAMILEALAAPTTEVKLVLLSRTARGTTSQMPGHGLFHIEPAKSIWINIVVVVTSMRDLLHRPSYRGATRQPRSCTEPLSNIRSCCPPALLQGA